MSAVPLPSGLPSELPPPAPVPAAAAPPRASEMSLRSLRIVLLLCILVPVLVYAGFGYYRWQQIHEEAAQRLQQSLRIANEHAQKVLETSEALLLHMLALSAPDEQSVPAAREAQLHAALRALARDKPQVHSLWIMGADGHALATALFSPPPAVSFSDRDYFIYHRDGGSDLYFSEILAGKSTRTPFFNLSMVRRDAEGRFAGVVASSLRPDYFQKIHADLVAGEPGMAITMFRKDGLVYSRWPQLPGQAARMGASSGVLQRVQAGQDQGVLRSVSSMDGQERLLMFQRVGRYPVYLGTGMDVAAVRADWLNEMALLGLFGALPVAGLLVAALVAMRRTGEAFDAERRLREESQARQQMEEALLQAQKLEALGRLTGGVAHDFNNALMVISGNLQILRMTHPQVVGRPTEAIARAVDSATKLTRQLLAFSRRQALMPQTVRLQDKLAPMAALLHPVLGSRIALEIEAAPDTAPVRVDMAEFELGLLNLAVNARDAMPAGGRLTVRARNADVLPPLQAGPMVVVEVSDTGTGISQDVLAKVFEPFFTTKPVGEGTGLGLSQVYALCQRSGGTVTLESTLGQGTTVRLFFPVATGADAVPEEPVAPAQRMDLHILLVEDNTEVAQAVRPVLQALGCTVTHFDRAARARDWLAQQPLLPDVLLTDVVMPGEMDGLALAQHVREKHPSMRIVVMTGYAEQMDTIAGLGFRILPKPWTAEMLAPLLRAPEPAASAG